MFRPSPLISRVSWMPGIRFSDSAMLRSGNLPMSSAKTESVKAMLSRLALVASASEALAEAGDDHFLDGVDRRGGCLSLGGQADEGGGQASGPDQGQPAAG
jgi:hypothetical protein